MEVYAPLFEMALGPQAGTFVTGTGEHGLLSDLCGLVVSWGLSFCLAVLFYHMASILISAYTQRYHPNAPCNKVSPKLQEYMVRVSHRAFPLYVTVVSFGEVFRKLGWSRHCESIEDCGGWAGTALNCVSYFLCVELLIFLDHYYLLHKFEWGKRVMKHSEHHVYKKADELNAWSAFAFAPQDGWSQGLPLALVTCVVRVPLPFVFFMEAATAVWTLYIHTDVRPLPWPFMGCNYHYLHHKYNWYNFGFMTCLFDTLFGTIKHPAPSDYSHMSAKSQ